MIGCSNGQSQANLPDQTSLAQVFEANDINKDGCLSATEWETMANGATEAISNEASNADQFRRWTLGVFTDMDTNGNSCITIPEYIEFGRKSSATESAAQ
jgi:hypothetical protein